MAQEQGEPIYKFVTRLREAADRCDFLDKDRDIQDQMVQKCFSEPLRQNVLREDPTLVNLRSAARPMEIANVQARAIENSLVLKVSQQPKSSRERQGQFKSLNKCDQNKQIDNQNKECLWWHVATSNLSKIMPSMGTDCRKFGKKNHYVRKCKRTKTVRKIDNTYESCEEDEYRVSAVKEKAKGGHNKITTKTDNYLLQFQSDSGADVNIIDKDSFSKLKGQVTVKNTRAKLFAHNSTVPLPLLGKFTATIATEKRYDAADFYVVKGSESTGCLLGFTSAVNLDMIHIVHCVKLKTRPSLKPKLLE